MLFERRKGEFSKTSGGKFESPPAPSLHELPYAISMTRYVHGEIRISIYPHIVSTKARRTTTVVNGACSDWLVGINAAVRERYIQLAVGASFLDSSSKFQGLYNRVPRRYRLPRKKIFRPAARRQILECARIAEEKYQKNCVVFTATVPGSGWRVAAAVAKCSPKIMNRIKQIFRDTLKADYSLFGVWEWQKRGMLHLHIAVATNNTGRLATLACQWKARWVNLLLDLSYEQKIDLFRRDKSWTWQDDLDSVQCDASWVKKSIGAYLSKYCTKEARGQSKRGCFYPSKWTTVDRKTAAAARARRIKTKRVGFTLPALNSVLSRFSAVFGTTADKRYEFANPQFDHCGGVIMFVEPERSELVALEFADFLTEFAVLASRLKTAC